MGDTTGISWTDHTFNPWWGCTKIAPGCDNCYAATLDKRTGGNYWDAHQKPRRTKPNNWRRVMKWQEQAEIENRRHRVFCGSMMDWCDKEVKNQEIGKARIDGELAHVKCTQEELDEIGMDDFYE